MIVYNAGVFEANSVSYPVSAVSVALYTIIIQWDSFVSPALYTIIIQCCLFIIVHYIEIPFLTTVSAVS